MAFRPDVLIAGGGIMGCLTASFLGQHGLTSWIIERDAIASQASGAAAGLLSPLAESAMPSPLTELCLHSDQLHRELVEPLQAESGIDYQFTDTPIVRPAFTQEQEEELRRQFEWQRAQNMRVSWLEGETLRRMSSWLPPTVRCAIYSEMEAQLETYSFSIAAAEAAERRGAVIKSGEVTGLAATGQRVRGLTLADGTVVEADAVLLAMGPWTCFAGEWIGMKVPVEPLRGQIIKLSSPGPMPEYAIFHGGGYVLPKPSGHILVGTTMERAGFVRQVTPEGQASIMDTALRLAPVLSGAQVLETSSCLRPLATDDMPIIGRVPGWDNLFIATGHGRKGILLSTATGKYLAQLIATGRSDYDLSPFGLERFAA